ncbi:MAG: DRTGG domain-containing protein [Acetanaerobacterium sp.]
MNLIMTVAELAKKTGFTILSGTQSLTSEIKHIYTCDLLSLVMGRAQAGDVWITVLGNVNTVAVAALADTACVILAEGTRLDGEALQKATAKDIAVLASELPVYESARIVADYL